MHGTDCLFPSENYLWRKQSLLKENFCQHRIRFFSFEPVQNFNLGRSSCWKMKIDISGLYHEIPDTSRFHRSLRAGQSISASVSKGANSMTDPIEELLPSSGVHIVLAKFEAVQQLNKLFMPWDFERGKKESITAVCIWYSHFVVHS